MTKMYGVDAPTITTAIAALDFLLLTRDFAQLADTPMTPGGGQRLKAETIKARHKLHEALGDDGNHIPQDPTVIFEQMRKHFGGPDGS